MSPTRTVFCLLLALGGCADHKYVPVSGRVNLDGKPLVNAFVYFQPMGGTLSKPAVGRGSYAQTDGEGRFALKVDASQKGAVAGRHRVTFSRKVNMAETLPAKLHSSDKLTFEVPPGGTEEANFELSSK